MKSLELRRWHIYILMFVAVIVPLLRPIGLPLRVGAQTRKVFDLLTRLRPGDVVNVSFDFQAPGLPELGPQLDVILPSFLERGIGVVAVAFHEEGVVYADTFVKKMINKGAKYGKDVLNLGFIPGGESALAAYAENVIGAAPRDYQGKPTAEYPIMKGINKITDFTMVIEMTSAPAGGIEVSGYVRQVVAGHGANLLVGSTALIVPRNMPYVESGQIKGIIAGLRGAAELETLFQKRGQATSLMDAQSLANVVVLVLMIAGNAFYFLSRRSARA